MSKQYQVERILQSRTVKGKDEYKIKWKGYSINECTWEPEEHLHYCKEMIRTFKQKKNNSNDIQANGIAKNTKPKRLSQAQRLGNDEIYTSQKDEDYKDTSKSVKKNSKSPKKTSNNRAPSKTNGRKDEYFDEEQENAENEAMQENIQAENENEEIAEGIEVLSLWIDKNNNGVHYKIRRNGVIETIQRSELLKLDILSILRFYERNLDFIPDQQ